MALEKIAKKLSAAVDALTFTEPVAAVYNPLAYAKKPLNQYLSQYGAPEKEIVLVGMNPGPFGMAQTGVPFGDVSMVRDWMRICAPVQQPPSVHPKRPVLGFDCDRCEVSGQRLWGWARQRYPKAEDFFQRFFVWNYCPLCFMEASGRNRTPDKLLPDERERLYAVCDDALSEVIKTLNPKYVIGVGKFALARIDAVLARTAAPHGRITGSILHPSPASPVANRGWAAAAETDLQRLGVQL